MAPEIAVQDVAAAKAQLLRGRVSEAHRDRSLHLIVLGSGRYYILTPDLPDGFDPASLLASTRYSFPSELPGSGLRIAD
jgi:hypothetical protein